MDVFKRQGKRIVFFLILSVVLSSSAFADNPKDSRDYDACLGIRFPLGIEFLVSDHISIGIELAPFFQILPPFAFRPYVIDQNAGIVIRYFL